MAHTLLCWRRLFLSLMLVTQVLAPANAVWAGVPGADAQIQQHAGPADRQATPLTGEPGVGQLYLPLVLSRNGEASGNSEKDQTPTGPPAAIESTLTLDLVADPPYAEPGDVVTFTVDARNPGESRLTNLLLTDTLPAGLIYVQHSAVGFEYSSNEKRLAWQIPSLPPGEAVHGSFQVRVQGLAVGESVTNTVTANRPGSTPAVTATATVDVAPPAADVLCANPSQSRWLRSLDGRVVLHIPPGAVNKRTCFSYAARLDLSDLPGRVRTAFVLEAIDEQGGAISHFEKMLDLAFYYPSDEFREEGAASLTLMYQDARTAEWGTLPTEQDRTRRRLSAPVSHFTLFAVGESENPDIVTEPMTQIRGAATALFSRSISYNHAFELPPGRGGLTPSLSLSYGSASHILQKGHYSYVGHGWELAGADYVYREPLIDTPAAGKITLMLRGRAYTLVKDPADNWAAKEDPFLRIRHKTTDLPNNDVDLVKWQITTAAGTRYEFGGAWHDDADISPHVYYWKCGDAQQNIPDQYEWSRVPLTHVRDSVDNTIRYTWEKETSWEASGYAGDSVPGRCNTSVGYTRALRLREISYNENRVHVTLTYENDRYDRPDRYDNTATKWSFFTLYRLRQIQVQVQRADNNVWSGVRQYVLKQHGYDGVPGALTAARSQATLELVGIDEEAGSGSTFLRRPTILAYPDPDGYLVNPGSMDYLERVANPYGGSVEFIANPGPVGAPPAVASRIEHDSTTTTAGIWTYSSNGWTEETNGYARVWVTRPDGVVEVFDFEQGPCYADGVRFCPMAGREIRMRICDSYDDATDQCSGEHSRTERDYGSEELARFSGMPDVHRPRFIRLEEERHYEASMPTRRITYAYQPDHQQVYTSGSWVNSQFGNVTAVGEYQGNGTGFATTPYRTTEKRYFPKDDAAGYIVNRIAEERLWEGAAGGGVCRSQARYNYDQDGGSDGYNNPPGQGLLREIWQAGHGQPAANSCDAGWVRSTRIDYDNHGNPTTRTASNGAVTITVYDDTFNVYPISTTVFPGPGGGATQHTGYRYYGINPASGGSGPVGLLQEAEDSNGAITRRSYDVLGRIIEIRRPGAAFSAPVTEWYAYDATEPFEIAHGLRDDPQADDAPNATYLRDWRYYDGLGRLIQSQAEMAVANQRSVTWLRYDAQDAVAAASVPYSVTVTGDGYLAPDLSQPSTTTTYDQLGRPIAVVQPDGATQTRSYYNGLLTAVVDAAGHQRLSETDVFGRLIGAYQYVGDYAAGPTWDASANYFHATYAYDVLDNLVSVTDGDGRVTTIGYDGLGRKMGMTDPDMGHWTYGYDTSGNLSRQTDARGVTLCYEYDGLNRLRYLREDLGGADCQWVGGQPGVDYQLRATQDYDAGANGIGRRSSVTAYDRGGGVSSERAWLYDVRGRMTAETLAIDGKTFVTGYGYDAMDRVVWQQYPGGDSGQAGERVDYAYTAQGLPKSAAGWDSYVTNATYDAAVRMLTRSLGSGNQTAFAYFSWEAGGGLGRLKSISTPGLQDLRYETSGAGAPGYDAVGNVTRIEDWLAGNPQTQTFGYDELDRLVSAAASGGADGKYSEAYQYAANGNLVRKGDPAALGGETCVEDPGAAGCYVYDEAHPHAVTAYSPVGGVGHGGQYEYDANGSMVRRADECAPQVLALTYDAENRLTAATEAALLVTVTNGAYGPMLVVDEPVADTATYELWAGAPCSGSQVYIQQVDTGPLAFIYPGSDNLLTRLLAYDEEGELLAVSNEVQLAGIPNGEPLEGRVSGAIAPGASVSASALVAQYFYDGDGVRVKTVVAGQTSYYVGEHYEVNGSGVKQNYFLGGQLVATRRSGFSDKNGLYFILKDHLGSTSVTAKETGVFQAEIRYKPYGASRYQTAGDQVTARRFTDQQWEGSLGLYDYGARFYDPYLNRWIQPDTIVPDPGNPQSLNRYAYVLNNPLKYTDPTGHWQIDLHSGPIVLWAAKLIISAMMPQEPRTPPVNAIESVECNASLPDCFGDKVYLKDFEENDESNPISIDEFEEFAGKVAEDLYTHDLTWPGYLSGRTAYDTPFYNGGKSERRAGNPEGLWPSDQQVCVETLSCTGRSDLNYIAQGMWAAAVGEPKPLSEAFVWAWKLREYGERPTEDALFWLEYGHDYYERWVESQE